ncbi:MAG TPA: HlyD family efflux transporter periplasmic adaptor subunit [Polyangia bacterium]|nr:HlyD family efflux transporter periplasmic adaptor subunit [Polyangia bacterium]
MTPQSTDQAAMDVPRLRPRRGPRRVLGYAAAIVVLVAVTVTLRQLRPAAPAVDRATVWIDTVKRGPLVREVQSQGELVPEEIRWISAVAPARVEKILVRPGTTVRSDTVLLVLANADLELGALEAERQLASGLSGLVNLQATLDSQQLAQQSHLASLRSELGEARRRAAADDDLAQKGYLSELERGQSRDRASELAGRLEFEQKRLAALVRGDGAQIAAQREQVERQRSIARVRRREVDDLGVKAGVDGVLQQLPLQVGQSVAAGALLAKVARPDRLKAEIRVPEVQAKDVRLQLPVAVDTHSAVIAGRVIRIDPAVQGGYVKVDVGLTGPLPAGARPDLSVTATIELDRLDNVLFVGRPAFGQSNATVGLFKLEPDGETAVRTSVRLGRGSVKAMEVLSGLGEGDRVILSDMAQWSAADRVRLR